MNNEQWLDTLEFPPERHRQGGMSEDALIRRIKTAGSWRELCVTQELNWGLRTFPQGPTPFPEKVDLDFFSPEDLKIKPVLQVFSVFLWTWGHKPFELSTNEVWNSCRDERNASLSSKLHPGLWCARAQQRNGWEGWGFTSKCWFFLFQGMINGWVGMRKNHVNKMFSNSKYLWSNELLIYFMPAVLSPWPLTMMKQ